MILGVVGTLSYQATTCVAVPSPTAQHAHGQCRRIKRRIGADGIILNRRAIGSKDVMAPLGHVTAHVVDSQFVGQEVHHLMGHRGTVAAVPGDIAHVVTAGIGVTASAATSTGGIFPLGLGGQTETASRHGTQAADEFLTVFPRHPLDGLVAVMPAAGISAHHALPQALCHLGLADVIVGQDHLVGHILARGVVTHHECAATHVDHVEVQTVLHYLNDAARRLL